MQNTNQTENREPHALERDRRLRMAPERGEQPVQQNELLELVYEHVGLVTRIRRSRTLSERIEDKSAKRKQLHGARAAEMLDYLVKLDKHIVDLVQADESELQTDTGSAKAIK